MENKKNGYAPVNGLNMYYEITGSGPFLIYLPPVFGYAGVNEFPELTCNWSVLTPDLQGNGRTADIDRPISFEQYAEDVVGLMKHLNIEKADFFGESFGGIVAMIIATRYSELVKKVAVYGTIFGAYQDSFKPEMLATNLSGSPEANGIKFQRENYKKVAPNPEYWSTVYQKVNSIRWPGFSKEELAAVKSPLLIAVGDHDFVRLDHSLEMYELIPKAELAVIPDAGHFVLNADQQKVIPAVVKFLNDPNDKLPFATTETGYHPGLTR